MSVRPNDVYFYGSASMPDTNGANIGRAGESTVAKNFNSEMAAAFNRAMATAK